MLLRWLAWRSADQEAEAKRRLERATEAVAGLDSRYEAWIGCVNNAEKPEQFEEVVGLLGDVFVEDGDRVWEEEFVRGEIDERVLGGRYRSGTRLGSRGPRRQVNPQGAGEITRATEN